MQEKQRVADMATEVLARQAEARAEWTGATFEISLTAQLVEKRRMTAPFSAMSPVPATSAVGQWPGRWP